MVVRFNLDFDIIAETIEVLRNASGAPDREARREVYDKLSDLLLFWECHGILCSGGLSIRELVAKATALPDQQRAPIKALVTGLVRQATQPARLPVSTDSNPLHLECCGLSLVSTDDALKAPDNGYPWIEFRESPVVDAIWGEDDWVIPVGCSAETIWYKRFALHAGTAKSVAIIDPFLMDDNGRRKDALAYFLERFDQSTKVQDYKVDIHTTSTFGTAMGHQLSLSLSSIPLRGSINVYMYPQSVDTKFPRDRWIRMDEVVVKLHGIDAFTHHTTGESCDRQQIYAAQDLIMLEYELTNSHPVHFPVH